MFNQKDYYKILNVSENASQEEIRKSYRKLAFQYHPDRNPGKEEMMKEINEAYAVLSDPKKRQEYDNFRQRYGAFAREHFRQAYTDEDIFRGSDIYHIFEELSRIFGFSSPEDIFSRNNFYGKHYQTFEFKGPGFFSKGVFFFGPISRPYQQRSIYRTHKTASPTAERQSLLAKFLFKGLDYLQKHTAKKFGINLPEKGKDIEDIIEIDQKDAISGKKIRYTFKNKKRDLLIKIPQGIKNGQRIMLKGMGEEGRHGGEPGDLYLKVKIHTPIFTKLKDIFKR